jgi:hypothetical protein
VTRRAALATAALETGALFGLLAWMWVAGVAAFRPDVLNEPVAAWLPLRRDTWGIANFAVSALSFLLLDFRRQLPWSGPSDGAR